MEAVMSKRNRAIRPEVATLAIVVAVSAVDARAADETGKWYFNPQGGYTLLDSSRDRDDDFHYGIGFGYHASRMFSLEVNGLWADFGGDDGLTLHQSAYSLDGLVVFGRENKVSPYLTFGGGYLANNFNGPSNWGGPMAQAGVGLMMDAGDGNFVFQFRPEVKYRHDWPDSPHAQSDSGDILVNLGFVFNFGGTQAAPMPVAQTPPPPPPPPPEPPPPPVDSDGDGVPDGADRCPGTPRGVVVDEKGCPTEPVILRGVEFATASATLTTGSRPILDAVAEDLKLHPLVRVELQGHTDSRGADAYNLDLSQRRADSVRDYLIAQGVAGTRLVAMGYGETQPIADNATATGRAENRRVVMKVIANPNNAEIKDETR
jgi:OOP family OmpA-OmpF porin